VGRLAVPMRHGLTLGEQARLARSDLHLAGALVVVPAAVRGTRLRRLVVFGGLAAKQAGEKGSPGTIRVLVVAGLRSHRRLPVG
jgi:hypothetical protein